MSEPTRHRNATDDASTDAVTVGVGFRPKVAAGVRWGAISQVLQVIVRFGAMLVMARLLTPRDFGLFALAMIVANLADLVVGLGVGDALVQRRALAPGHVRSAFTVSALSGVAIAAAMAGARHPIARVRGNADVAPVVGVLGLMFVFSGIERTPNDMLVRSLRMRDFYLSSTVATVISAIAGVSMALGHHGVWALVVMALSEAFVATALAWAFALRARVWRPSLGIELAYARSLAGFGALVTGARVAGYGQSNFDNLVVGRVLGAGPLGYYSVAYRTVLLPIVKVSEVIGATVFAAFAGVQDDLVRLRRGVRQANCYVAIVCLPTTIGLSVCAAVLVPVTLGERWLPAVHVVELLALGGPALSFVRLENSLYKALGRPSISFAMSAVQLVVTVPAYLIGSHWGIDGVAIAVVTSTYATLPITAAVRGRLLQQPMRDAITPLAPILFSTAAMAGAAFLVRVTLVHRTSAVLTLFATVASGVAVYGALMLLTARGLLLEALADLRRSG